jgi:recombination protein RecR
VEGVQDLLAIERTGEFHGLYHVLHGSLSPLRGVGPDQLTLAHLLRRVREEGPAEVVIATNVNVEGEATASYIQRLLVPLGVQTSRIATGVPQGSSLEFLDQTTLGRAIAGRRPI